MIDWKKVAQIAKETRRDFEDFVQNHSKFVDLHNFDQSYKGKKERLSYPDVNKYHAGWCGLASSMLKKRLRKNGIPANLRIGLYDKSIFGEEANHFWVQVGNKIVDITASQFKNGKERNPNIVITSAKNPIYHRTKYDISDWEASELPTAERMKHLNQHHVGRLQKVMSEMIAKNPPLGMKYITQRTKWWNKLSRKEQQSYIKQHPNSHFKVTAMNEYAKVSLELGATVFKKPVGYVKSNPLNSKDKVPDKEDWSKQPKSGWEGMSDIAKKGYITGHPKSPYTRMASPSVKNATIKNRKDYHEASKAFHKGKYDSMEGAKPNSPESKQRLMHLQAHDLHNNALSTVDPSSTFHHAYPKHLENLQRHYADMETHAKSNKMGTGTGHTRFITKG